MYQLGPNTLRNLNLDRVSDRDLNKMNEIMNINTNGLFNTTGELNSKTFDYIKPSRSVRKRSMNKQSSKNQMLFNLLPTHTVSVDSSAHLYKKKRRKSKILQFLIHLEFGLSEVNFNTNHSSTHNMMIKDKTINGKLIINPSNRHMESTYNSYGKVLYSDR